MFRNISVIGLGKLGYPMAQFLSSSGAKISCYDKDEKLVNDLKKNHGEHLHEIGLNNLVNNSLYEITVNKYRTFIVLIDYDKDLPSIFRKQFLAIKNNKPHLIAKNGLYEKDMLKWYSYLDIKNKFNEFRPFYKNIVKKILELF